MNRAVAALTLAAALTLTAGCAPVAEDSSQEAVVVHTGLEAPWSVAFVQGATLVSERDTARILELDEAGGKRVVGEVKEAAPRGEGGLLGLAVHDGHLYTYVTTSGDNRILRYRIEGKPGGLSLGPAEAVLTGMARAGIHNGGRIAFGPDGMLYATVGDAGEETAAQDPTRLAGKILRVTPDGQIPQDNPFPGSPVFSYGHRNPQGIAWDEAGTLYSSEFGQNRWDELNVIVPGGNYGWPEVEGIDGAPGATVDGFINPVQQWETGQASPSGMAVSSGSIYVANLRGERVRVVPLDDLGSSRERLAGAYGRLRDVVKAPDGSLLVLTNNTDGRGSPGEDDDRLLRIAP